MKIEQTITIDGNFEKSCDSRLETIRQLIKDTKISDMECTESKVLVLLHTLLHIKVVIDEP